jgi:hypothetical protein
MSNRTTHDLELVFDGAKLPWKARSLGIRLGGKHGYLRGNAQWLTALCLSGVIGSLYQHLTLYESWSAKRILIRLLSSVELSAVLLKSEEELLITMQIGRPCPVTPVPWPH